MGTNRLGWLLFLVAFPVGCSGTDDPSAQSKSVADLIAALNEQDEDKQSYTAIQLARIGKDAVPPLLTALRDKSSNVRAGAACALGMILPPDRHLIPSLLAATNDKDGRVREAAFSALGNFDPAPEALAPGLGELLKNDPSPNRRQFAVLLLEKIASESPATIAVLEAALKDADCDVRRFASRALGAIGPEARCAGPRLLECCKDSQVLEEAAPALVRIRGLLPRTIVSG